MYVCTLRWITLLRAQDEDTYIYNCSQKLGDICIEYIARSIWWFFLLNKETRGKQNQMLLFLYRFVLVLRYPLIFLTISRRDRTWRTALPFSISSYFLALWEEIGLLTSVIDVIARDVRSFWFKRDKDFHKSVISSDCNFR